MIDDRSTILKKKKNHCFFRKIKIQKIFFFNIKIFFILKFVKKICDFFSAKNFFCDIFFGGKSFCRFTRTLDIFLNTHTQFLKILFLKIFNSEYRLNETFRNRLKFGLKFVKKRSNRTFYVKSHIFYEIAHFFCEIAHFL